MTGEFRVDPKQKWMLWAGVVFFPTILLASLAGTLHEDGGITNDAWRIVTFGLMFVPVYGTMWLLSLYGLRGFYIHRLRITDDAIECVDVFARRRVAIRDVDRVRWRPILGDVTLHAGDSRVTFGCGVYTKDDQRKILRWVREAFPLDIQEGFVAFYGRRLRPKSAVRRRSTPDPERGDVVLPRWRLSPFWIVCLVASVALAVADVFDPWLPGVWSWPGPFLVIGGWIFTQFSMPKEGHVHTREERTSVWIMTLVFVLVIAFMVLIPAMGKQVLHVVAMALLVLMGVAFVVMLPLSVVMTRRQWAREDREAEAILAEHGPVPPELMEE